MKVLNRIILFVMLGSSFVFANVVGTITALQGTAFIVRNGNNIQATLGASLNEKDSIKTKDKSKVQIIFKDETIITIGKKSNFSIDEYLFDDKNAPKAKFGLISGAMRTITGKIGKIAPDRFSVKTKTATIGIRGTNFSILAGADGGTKVFCTFGAISVSMKGVTSIVPQGFYVRVSASGKTSKPVKFTPKDLKEMRAESFTASASDGGSKKKKAVVAVLKKIEADTPVDTTTPSDIGLVVKDVTGIVTDGTFASVVDTATASSSPIVLAGYGVSSMNDNSVYGGLTITGSSFSSGTITEVDSDGYKWAYTIGSPTTYSSMDSFSAPITGVTYSFGAITDVAFTSSYFNATGDDLSSDDSMSWGEWGVNFTYKDGGSSLSRDVTGLWIGGVVTPASVIAGYASHNFVANYSGRYRAIDFTSSNAIVNGVATLTVDFGQSNASLTIAAKTNSWAETTYAMTINGTTMHFANGYGNKANGTFYGANGKSVGGNFVIAPNGGLQAKGVYEVTTTSIH
jgi:hypothetical protein